jgi:serine/threonine protein kinase
MTEEERERRLAEELAEYLDQCAAEEDPFAGPPTRTIRPELMAEISALREIDEILKPGQELPDRLSGHRIVEEIGSGGMGRVLLAMDESLGRKVAIKTLAPRYADQPVLRTRFMSEARAMARLNHPNVARIYSLGPPAEPPHFVMEYLEGAPLTTAAAGLTFEQRADLMRKVALAAEFLHEQGIVHRDLKPGNILVDAALEPKLLDFGLALELGAERLSLAGEIAGTPEYLSPEQAAGGQSLDARSDVFSLGAILYELLTGVAPFTGKDVHGLLRSIREEDPVLPRRRTAAVPRDLQNICLKAMEKDPANRYASAREMADDLRRFLARETVLAEPAAYARLITGKVEQHLRDLESWRQDQVISESEYEGLRHRYGRLLEREDSWILEARRLTLPQVTLYLGVWVLCVGAAFLTFFPYPTLQGWLAPVVAWTAALPVAWIGMREWRRGYYRVAVAYLLAFCLLAPVAVLVGLEEAAWLTGLTNGDVRQELFHRLEFEKKATNAQLWWAILAGLPVSWWMRRFTRAPVFSLVFSSMAVLLSLATLLRMGMLDWLDHDPGRFYLRLFPVAALFFAAGLLFERRRMTDDSRYFYPFAVVFTWAALSGVALFHEPYASWLKAAAPWTRGQLEYLFILNAGVYFLLDRILDRTKSNQLHTIGKTFRFVIPGHVLTSLLLLGLNAEQTGEKRLLEWLLPAAACCFVFLSIPRQMKNFFFTGLLFFAVGAFRLQQEALHSRAGWPVTLMVAGLVLMWTAARYAPLRVSLGRILKTVWSK